MKKSSSNRLEIVGRSIISFFILIALILINSGCSKDSLQKDLSGTSLNAPDLRKASIPLAEDFRTVVLVADTAGFNAGRIDENLKNPWGIAINPNGPIWISANHTGLSVIYNANGNQLRAPVNIPLGDNPNGASPTGQIFNSTTDFIIPGKGKSSFIFSTEDGIISAWNGSLGSNAMTVVDMSSTGAVYKGLALAVDDSANFIYATDFHNARIDVFDKDFALVTTKPFNDPKIPNGYAPFNIQNINGSLWVTYAKQLAPDFKDDEAGSGNGYVDIYTPAGKLVKRFASRGSLNSPWGIAWAAKFGEITDAILIGNFGDGHINAFKTNGDFHGQLKENGKEGKENGKNREKENDKDKGKEKEKDNAIIIPGLWAITFDPVAPADPEKLYFTAGPDEETHGLFGYVEKIVK